MSTREVVEPALVTSDEIDRVLSIVSKQFRTHVMDIVARPDRRGPPRKGDEAARDARHVAMYVANHRRFMTSITEIGRRFNCDHSTVIAGCDRIAREVARGTTLGRYAKGLLDQLDGRFEVGR